MPKVTNTTTSQIVLPTGTVIPPKSAVHIPHKTLAGGDNQPFLAAMVNSRKLVIGSVPSEAEPGEPVPELTRGEVSRMRRAELEELGIALGLTSEQISGMTVEPLREVVSRAMFVDL